MLCPIQDEGCDNNYCVLRVSDPEFINTVVEELDQS